MEFPLDLIGTEIFSDGGSIDLVRKLADDSYILYEIKTSKEPRLNIRHGLSQLLEYAYWKAKINIKKLIIIGPVEIDEDSKIYLEFIRQEFKILVYYQFYDLDTDSLSIES